MQMFRLSQQNLTPQRLQQVGWGLALSVVSSGLNGLLAWVMFRSADVHRSVALEADARHLVEDAWTPVGVVAGIAVALNILWRGFHLVWRLSQGLMDVYPLIESKSARYADSASVLEHVIKGKGN